MVMRSSQHRQCLTQICHSKDKVVEVLSSKIYEYSPLTCGWADVAYFTSGRNDAERGRYRFIHKGLQRLNLLEYCQDIRDREHLRNTAFRAYSCTNHVRICCWASVAVLGTVRRTPSSVLNSCYSMALSCYCTTLYLLNRVGRSLSCRLVLLVCPLSHDVYCTLYFLLWLWQVLILNYYVLLYYIYHFPIYTTVWSSNVQLS